jgi:hypothetical protein
MAAGAAPRRRAADAAARADSDREWRRELGELERRGREWAASMTLGEAFDRLHYDGPVIGCACVGLPYCCMVRADQARALLRGAHITAKLLADAAAAH